MPNIISGRWLIALTDESDRNLEALTCAALRAFEGLHIQAGHGGFDAGEPHRRAAFGASQDADLSAAIEWIRMG